MRQEPRRVRTVRAISCCSLWLCNEYMTSVCSIHLCRAKQPQQALDTVTTLRLWEQSKEVVKDFSKRLDVGKKAEAQAA